MLPKVITRRRSLPNFVDEFFNGDLFPGMLNWENGYNTSPAVNVQESEKEYSIEVAAPGLSKKDFHVNIEDNVLTVASESKQENEEKEDNYLRREFHYNAFKRCFTLPENTDADSIKASHKDGILYISVPKAEAKSIPVKEVKIN